jgi:hypothetical protein
MRYLQEQRRNNSKLILLVSVTLNKLINLSIFYSVPIFNQFGRIETSDELFKLVTRIIPIEKENVLSAIKWLKVMSHDSLLNLTFFSFYI